MGLQTDWYNKIVQITSPTVSVDMQTLHDFIEDEMVSVRGGLEDDILTPEGKIADPNNPGTFSQIIVKLSPLWQVQFWQGSGYTQIYGGKLVGGLNNQPLKATGAAGDITVLISPVDGITSVSETGVSGLTEPESQAVLNNAANIDLIQASIASIEGNIILMQTDIAALQGDIATITTDIGEIKGDIVSIKDNIITMETTLGTMALDVSALQVSTAFMMAIEAGEWKIENHQMICFRSGGGGEMMRFNLFNVNGLPTNEDVYRRVPV